MPPGGSRSSTLTVVLAAADSVLLPLLSEPVGAAEASEPLAEAVLEPDALPVAETEEAAAVEPGEAVH